jgi:hypothetical protein
MKKLLGLALIIVLLQLSGTRSRAALLNPTACPTNFTCSITASGTRPLTGTATDGHAISIIGTISFDASSNVSGFFAINSNGTLSTANLAGATCTSGTGDGLGSIDFTPQTGHTLVFDFVTFVTSTGDTGLLVADATPVTTNGADVLVGKCLPAPTKS